ncbi:hypothetical protein AgCh_019349 [Apium graveolens]
MKAPLCRPPMTIGSKWLRNGTDDSLFNVVVVGGASSSHLRGAVRPEKSYPRYVETGEGAKESGPRCKVGQGTRWEHNIIALRIYKMLIRLLSQRQQHSREESEIMNTMVTEAAIVMDFIDTSDEPQGSGPRPDKSPNHHRQRLSRGKNLMEDYFVDRPIFFVAVLGCISVPHLEVS